MGAQRFGFGRWHVSGHRPAWLIEAVAATAAERMCALPSEEATRWIALARIEVSPEVEHGVREREVLVMVERTGLPTLDVSPAAVDLRDLLPRDEAPIEATEPVATDFIEVQVVDARGRPRPSVRYVLRFPDGRQIAGTTDSDGMVRRERLGCGGDCTLVLPDVEAA